MPYFYPHGDHWSEGDNASCTQCKASFVPTGKATFSRTRPPNLPSQTNGVGSPKPIVMNGGGNSQTTTKPTTDRKPEQSKLPVYGLKIQNHPRAKVNTGGGVTGQTGSPKTPTTSNKPPPQDSKVVSTGGTTQTKPSNNKPGELTVAEQKLANARERLNTTLMDQVRRLKEAPIDQKARNLLVEQAKSIKQSIVAARTLAEIMDVIPKLKELAAAIPPAQPSAVEKLEGAYASLRVRGQEIRDAAPVVGTEVPQKAVADDVNFIEGVLQRKDEQAAPGALRLVPGLEAKFSNYATALRLAEAKQKLESGITTFAEDLRQIREQKNLPQAAIEAKQYVLECIRQIQLARKGQNIEAIEKAIGLVAEVKKGMQKFRTAISQSKPQPTVTPPTPQSSGPQTQSTQSPGKSPQEKQTQVNQNPSQQAIALPKEDQDAIGLLRNSKREALAGAASDTLTALHIVIAGGPAPTDKVKQAAYEKAVKARQLLLRDLQGGPLSVPSPGGTFDQAAKDIIAGYADAPELSSKALDIAQTAKHPEVLAAGVKTASAIAAKGFGGYAAETANTLAANALKIGGDMGGDYFERMGRYYESGRNKEKNKTYEGDFQSTGTRMAQHMGEAMIDENGQMRLDGDFDKLRDTLQFHVDSLLNPFPAALANIEDVRSMCLDEKNKKQMQEILNGLGKSKPAPPTAIHAQLISKTLGKPPKDLAPYDQQKAVMSAMFTPLDQGPVGSCFATAPARKQRLTKPLDVMKDFAQIAGSGRLTKGRGLSEMTLPAIKTDAKGENPLLRSWEYTVTTMSACLNDGKEKKKLTNCLFGAYGGQSDSLGTLGGDRGTIEKKLADSFTFLYDPAKNVGKSSDGSSSKGAFVLQHRTPVKGGPDVLTPMTDKTAFMTKLEKILEEALCAGLGPEPKRKKLQEIRSLLASPKFEETLKKGFMNNGAPWAWPSGGQSEDPTEILTNQKLTSKPLVTPKESDPPEIKTENLLNKLVDQFVPDGGQDIPSYAPVGVIGIHEMNAMPTDLADLKGSTPEETKQKIKTALVDPGKEIAKTRFDPHRAEYLHAQLIEGLPLQPPKPKPPGGLTPDGFKKFCRAQGIAESKIDSLLLRQLKCPERIVADTNWGNGTQHTYFVIAPNPTSGNLMLWKKSEFKGEYVPAEAKWLDSGWEYLG